MTPALALLARAEAAGLSLTVDRDALRLRGPRPDDALLAELTAHKPALLAALRQPRAPGMSTAENNPSSLPARDAAKDDAALAGYRRAALARPVSWGDAAALPVPGCFCRNCGGRQWWCERVDPSGWRCALCHPGSHLPAPDRREVAT